MNGQTQINFLEDQTNKKFNINNRRYLGNKYKLLDFINKVVEENCKGINSVADIFAGTGVVAKNFYSKEKNVIVNDILYSNYLIYYTWFDSEKVNIQKLKQYIDEFNKTEVQEENYMSINFGGNYFSKKNAKKIGYIREHIENLFKKKFINFREKCILITSLLYAADKVANTCGHYDAFRKKLDSFQELILYMPDIENNNLISKNQIYNRDANDLVKEIYADLVYIDTPYNSRQYGDAYHLLENIAQWEKPEVQGIAKKMVGRENIKSKYCTQKAPEAFKDLISNINAKYILVSYNNMAQKGVGRSNAKISNEEIIEILNEKGNVKIFSIDYKAFTTGKSSIENHKEILYLCEVDNITLNKKKQYKKSCLNYTGGKYKLLKQIIPLFPKKINTFIDIFCGGCNVGINVEAEKIICNDNQEQIISLYNTLKSNELNKLIGIIETIIEEFRLSNSTEYGYDFYNVLSKDGLGKYNKDGYLSLRQKYNYFEAKSKDDILYKNMMFFVLIVYGFNNQVRFNSRGEFNIPVGKRDFNSSIRKKLIEFVEIIKEKDIKFINKDFRTFNWEVLNENDFVYLDPPYLISTASYNEQGGWTDKDEIELLNLLDYLNRKNIKFALSNVIKHKNMTNKILEEWSKKYNINYIDYNYKNANYQKKDKKSDSIEVLITNY